MWERNVWPHWHEGWYGDMKVYCCHVVSLHVKGRVLKVHWDRLIVHALIHKAITHTKVSQWRNGNTEEYLIQMKAGKKTKELVIKSRWQKKHTHKNKIIDLLWWTAILENSFYTGKIELL